MPPPLPRSVCVFCGSSDRGSRVHKAEAARLGRLLAQAGIELVYGGGRVGIMGVIANAALEAGGRVVGVIPEHLMRREVGHLGTTELIVTASMHERKATMFARADAFVVLPGGPGTLDETFEILTWRQLSLHDKPVVVCDMGGYWKPLVDLVRHMERSRYVQKSFLGFFSVVPRVDDVLDALRAAPAPRKPVRADRI
jgi:uncharacterized protein (TIGR00730 family)